MQTLVLHKAIDHQPSAMTVQSTIQTTIWSAAKNDSHVSLVVIILNDQQATTLTKDRVVLNNQQLHRKKMETRV